MDNIRSGTTIRQPSTANLNISSFDRKQGSASDFTISPPQNILSGFFTRFGVVEIVLDWYVPNISSLNLNNTFTVIIASVPFTITIPDGFYNISTLLATMIPLLNTATSQVFTLTGPLGARLLTCGVVYSVALTSLAYELGIFSSAPPGSPGPPPITPPPTTPALTQVIFIPYIIGKNRYLDFVCDTLTYQQGLKDATTSTSSRDVLYRWNLSWDDYVEKDADGYQIYQGYEPFKSRRYLSYPKQIRWDSQQPIGQLKFEVYNAGLYLLATNSTISPTIVEAGIGGLEFNMTLLVSEQ